MKNDRKLTYICRITTFKGGYFIEGKKNVKYNWIKKIKKQKNISGKQDDNFCLKSLVEVCKKCYTPLPSNHVQAICDRCIAEKEDKKDKGAKMAGKAGAGVAGAEGLAVVGKKAFDIAKGIIFKA